MWYFCAVFHKKGILELEYSDSTSNNGSHDYSILEQMDLLELKLLEAQKDLAEFNSNLDAVSQHIAPATEVDDAVQPVEMVDIQLVL